MNNSRQTRTGVFRRWMLCSMACLLAASLPAQSRIEYFWNTDPGIGRANKVAGGNGEVSFQLSTDKLPYGANLLGIRALNGKYASYTITKIIYKSPMAHNTGHVEYFWDEDPGVGRATVCPATFNNGDATVSLDLPTAGLGGGMHLLGLRAYNGSGWTSTHTHMVTVVPDGGRIDRVEYFWDEDPGYGLATPLAFTGDTIALVNEDIPAPQESGTHVLVVRALAGGHWSLPLVQIVCVKAVELDENSETSPVDQDTYANEVTTNRTLKAGQWNTLCLPFDLDAEQIAEAGITEVRTLSGVTVTNEAGFVSFTPVNDMEAGKPYLVKVAQTTTLAFGDVWVQAADSVAVVVNGASMEGFYCLTTLKDVYYISNDRFYYADVPVTSKGFRAFIALTEAANVESLAIRLDDATGIEDAEAGDDGLVDVYTVNGVRLRTGVERAKALEGLPRGIYIVNGKKAVK